MTGDRDDDAPKASAATERSVLDFASLPVAAMHIADQRVVAVNAAYEQLTSLTAAQIVGRHVAELIATFVIDDDARLLNNAPDRPDGTQSGPREPGEVWCRVTDTRGITRTVRVVWRIVTDGVSPDDRVVFLLPADTDAYERAFAERLAYAATTMLRCANEAEVLERAADALSADGYTVTMLLLHEDDPLLVYGPTRTPQSSPDAPDFQSVRPPRDVLTRFNPRFHERRAAFFQRPATLVRDAYPEEMGKKLAAKLPGNRTVQAPIFVADAPYGAMVVTDDRLTHVSVGTLEMYAQLVGAAIENVRNHQRATERLHELERLQDALVQRERLAALGEAAAVMAHEVRNPIAAILNAVTLLERGRTTGMPDTELHRMIAEEAGRLERLVSDLLALGRPLLPRLRETNLAEVADGVVGMLRARGEIQSCVVEPVQSDGSVAIADPELVELALLNVVRNAIQASPSDGHIRVDVRSEEADRIALSVEDDGPGVSEEVAERMLEPFFTTRATGTGIGLAVVRRVLDANRGSLTIGRSRSGGVKITLHFPAHAS